MVKFEPFNRNIISDSSNVENDLEKFRSEAEEIITTLEHRCESLDDMCYNASELIDELMTHYSNLESIAHLTSGRCHDLEKRLDTLEHEYKVEVNRMKCSDVITAMGFMVALYAICLGIAAAY
jgi:predicted nuclease with TOPRIM domain